MKFPDDKCYKCRGIKQVTFEIQLENTLNKLEKSSVQTGFVFSTIKVKFSFTRHHTQNETINLQIYGNTSETVNQRKFLRRNGAKN